MPGLHGQVYQHLAIAQDALKDVSVAVVSDLKKSHLFYCSIGPSRGASTDRRSGCCHDSQMQESQNALPDRRHQEAAA